MKAKRRVLMIVSVLCASFVAQAVGPQVSAEFLIQEPATHKLTPANTARLDQYVCLRLRGLLTPDGDHTLQLVIYDGLGREVYLVKNTITAEQGVWRDFGCYGYQKRDAPGTWFYVGELDGEPLFNASFEVRPAGRPRE